MRKTYIGRFVVVSVLLGLILPLLTNQMFALFSQANIQQPSVVSVEYAISASVNTLCIFIVILIALRNYVDGSEDDFFAEDEGAEAGIVKWFNVSKGFGFITRDNGEDIFVHFRSIRGRGHRSLSEGQRVKFSIVESKKGLQADNVTVVAKQ